MKILLAIDDSRFSEAATQSVASQFRPQETEVQVLNVVEPISIATPPQMSPGYYPELEDQVRQARVLVERAERTLSSAGFSVSTSVAEGNAKSVIGDWIDVHRVRGRQGCRDGGGTNWRHRGGSGK